MDFFTGILEQAAVAGLSQVAMSINKFIRRDDKNFLALTVLGPRATGLRMRLSVTTNYENVLRWGAAAYQHCALVSLSYDEFKFPTQVIPEDFLRAVRFLKAEIPLVNVNVLLTKRIMQELKTGSLRKLLDYADSLYLLMPKGHPADFSHREFAEFLGWLLPLLDDYSLFQRVSLDNCLRPFIPVLAPVYPHCERGHQIVAVGPGGELAYSVYDTPFAVLNHPTEFIEVFEQMFAATPESGRSTKAEWLCEGKTACPWIEFNDVARVAE